MVLRLIQLLFRSEVPKISPLPKPLPVRLVATIFHADVIPRRSSGGPLRVTWTTLGIKFKLFRVMVHMTIIVLVINVNIILYQIKAAVDLKFNIFH